MSLLSTFRWITFVEGISYVLLVFVAMPLKYMAGLPQAVRWVGMAHGVLFVGFVVLLLLVAARFRWSPKASFLVFVSSLVPVGTFFIDGYIVRMSTETGVSEPEADQS